MKATTFKLNVLLPRDARLLDMVRELVVQAAQCAGCGEAEARAFGRAVETTTRDTLENTHSRARLPVVVRQTGGPLEVLVDGRRIILQTS